MTAPKQTLADFMKHGMRKGGTNAEPSQVTDRPPSPPASNPPATLDYPGRAHALSVLARCREITKGWPGSPKDDKK